MKIKIIFILAILLIPAMMIYSTDSEAYSGSGTSSAEVGNLPPEYQNIKVVVRGEELSIVVVVSDYNSYYDISSVSVDILDINYEENICQCC